MAPSNASVVRVVAIVVATAVGLYLVYVLRKPISWIVIGGFLAIAMSAPVNWLQKRLKRRGAAIGMVFTGVILVPVAIGAILIPPLVKETDRLIDRLPAYAQDVQDYVNDSKTLSKLERDYDITGTIQDQADKLPGQLGGAAGVLSDIGFGLVNSVFALVTILILAAFMLGSGGRWIDAAISSRPPPEQEGLRDAARDISAAVVGYVAGAIGQALIAGVTAYVVLRILGVPYAAALALIVALLDLVPLVGATIGAVIVAVVTVFHDFPTATIVWVVWSIVYQQVENTVIQPRIQSRTVKVQPFLVIVAVLFGSTLFGVLGALLAIPAAATIQIVIREVRRYRAQTASAASSSASTVPAS